MYGADRMGGISLLPCKRQRIHGAAIWAVAVLAVLAGTSPGVASEADAGAPSSDPLRAVKGYVASWNVYGDAPDIADIDGDALTHIYYAFGAVSDQGLAELGDSCADIGACGDYATVAPGGNFAALAAFKQRHPHLRVMISIGGWTGSTHFSEMARTPESRERFVRSAIDLFIGGYPMIFDGIDIDWEYPVSGGLPDNTYHPSDRRNFTKLMEEFRRQLDTLAHPRDDRYQLSIAVSASVPMLDNIEPAALGAVVDWINVMTYDYVAGTGVTGFNAPLHQAPEASALAGSVEESIRAFHAAGVPAERLVLGLPFYGRVFSGVSGSGDGLFRPATPGGEPHWDSETVAYRQLDRLREAVPDLTEYWHDPTQVPYLYSGDGGVWVTYDDARSIGLKTDFARREQLGGVMIWELGSDDGTLLDAVDSVAGPR